MKVAVFTADEYNGGIMQYTLKLAETCLKIGHETRLYVPNNDRIHIPIELKNIVYQYQKVKTVFGESSAIKDIANLINDYSPDFFLAGDEAILTSQVIKYISDGVRKYITVHDVTPHPVEFGFRRRIVYTLARVYRNRSFKYADTILLLSENSKNKFITNFNKYSDKIKLFRLGAHPPISISETVPPEIVSKDIHEYVLYFGRIEKYKGVNRLIHAFNNVCMKTTLNYSLIIAGKGDIEEKETDIVANNPRIYLINRFIRDEEMVWLIKNCMAVVAPYIEASQSGVVPMAYHYGRGIIASNIGGLNEFVIPNKTGTLFSNDQQLEDILSDLNGKDSFVREEDCLKFESDYLNWERNLNRVLQK